MAYIAIIAFGWSFVWLQEFFRELIIYCLCCVSNVTWHTKHKIYCLSITGDCSDLIMFVLLGLYSDQIVTMVYTLTVINLKLIRRVKPPLLPSPHLGQSFPRHFVLTLDLHLHYAHPFGTLCMFSNTIHVMCGAGEIV